MKEILKNKIVLIFGILFFVAIFGFISVSNLIYENNIINKKLSAYNSEFKILERNSELEKNWQELERIILEKRELIETEKWQLELLVENKLRVEWEIQENRKKIFNKNENVK